MADFALDTANKVSVDQTVDRSGQHTTIAGENITAGAPCYLGTTDGKAYNSDGNGSGTTSCFGIAARTVTTGQEITLIRRGLMSGWNFGSANYGASVYVSDTVGILADAAGTTSIKVGIIVPVWTTAIGTSPDRALLVECNNDKA